MNQQTDLEDVRRQSRERDSAGTMQRTLSTWQLVLLGIGAIIGAGIFVSTGTIAAHHTGPAIVLSFLLASAACLCAGLCYAEFAATMPVSGSAYSYVRAAFGNAMGWMIGWCLILEYLMAAATVAVGWASYLRGLLGSLGVEIVAMFTSPPYVISATGELLRTGAVMNLPAVALPVVLSALLIGGVRLSVRMNALLVTIKLTVILLFIVCGAFYVNPANWHPFLPANSGHSGEFGWSGVLRGAAVIFYAYLGFDTVSTAARETRNPRVSMPIGIIGSLAFSTLVYIAFSLVLTGLAPYPSLAVANPVSAALTHAGPQLHFLKIAVEVGAVVGLTSVVLVLLYGQSRILYAMAQDRLIPAAFGRISAHSRTPYVCVGLCGMIAAVAAGMFPIEMLGELISIGTLCAFIFVCAGVLYLRLKQPTLERPFRTPFAPLTCTVGILTCGYLLSGLPLHTWLRFLAWMAVGAGIYAAYGRRHAARGRLAPAALLS